MTRFMLLLLFATACSSELSQSPSDAVTGTFSGEVTRSTYPEIAVGTRCSGTMRRERGASTAKATLRCGRIAVYDGTGQFIFDVRDPTKREDDVALFDDPRTSDVDGTPAMKISGENGKADGSSGTLELWDRYELAIKL